MKKWIATTVMMLALAPLAQALESGKPAPDFTAKTSDGKIVKLSDYKGKKVVVLEWLNYGCPFVKKHYGSKNMQKLQGQFKNAKADAGAVWFSVISSAPGKQGHVDAKQAEADRKAQGSKADGVILDETGALGRLYGAKTTPHMFVVNRAGILVYQGAIDDKPSTEIEDVKTAENFVVPAVEAALKGDEMRPRKAMVEAYGCGVKYN